MRVFPPKLVKLRETDLVKSCIQYLEMKRIKAWRNNSGAQVSEYNGKKRFFKYGATGSPDILAVEPKTGRLINIECKVGKNTMSDSQKQWKKEMEATGALYWLIYNIEELVGKLS